MTIQEIFDEKVTKSKEKTAQLSIALILGEISISELGQFAANSKDATKATCIEGIEVATKSNPELMNSEVFESILINVSSKSPRVIWESSRVVGNTVAYFPQKTEEAVFALLKNAKHEGTVVRWSTAFALSAILNLNSAINQSLVPAVEKIVAEEEKASIKKIYLKALKAISRSK